MAKDESSCLIYDRRYLAIYFPEGDVCCKLCPVLETYARRQCRATGEYLKDSWIVGMRCPLVEYPGTIGHVPDEFMGIR